MIALELGIEDLQEKFSSAAQEKEVKFEVYGLNYSKSPTESNFVRSIGLTTQISKNYATMITVGATAGGYVPGVEATAFSRWNVGIKDRFKNNLIDGDSRSEDPLSDFGKENKGIREKYKEYLIQPIEDIIGINYKSEDNSTSYPENSSNTGSDMNPTTRNYYSGMNMDANYRDSSLLKKAVLSAMGVKNIC